jgi:FecR protein
VNHLCHPPSSLLARLRLASLCIALAGVCGTSLAQTRAAQVMVVTGSVVAIDTQGQRRQLVKGSDVRPGDSIVTGEGALAQIRMSDGGFISIRSATEMAIDRFVFDEKESSKSNFLVSLVKGGFRSITGLIGKTNPNAYQIRSATATIGIRGTDHEPMVILPGNPSLGAPGLYDKVNDGETFIRSERGMLALRRGQIGFAPAVPTQAPQALQRVPDFYKVDIKTDARDPKDAVTTSKAPEPDKPAADAAVLLRPSTAARRDALKDTDALSAVPGALPVTSLAVPVVGNLLAPSAAVAASPGSVLSTSATLLAPASATVSNSALLVSPITPLATVASPASTLVLNPNLNLLNSAATLTTPAANLIAPIVAAPVTTLTVPSVNLVAPMATLAVPVTTVAPITPVLAPAAILVAPIAAPVVTTVVAPVIAVPAPVLVAPIVTIKSIVVK